MTVYECMGMLGRHEKVRVFEGDKPLIAVPTSEYEFEQYVDEYSREVFDAILEKTAVTVDLVQMIIYCEE